MDFISENMFVVPVAFSKEHKNKLAHCRDARVSAWTWTYLQQSSSDNENDPELENLSPTLAEQQPAAEVELVDCPDGSQAATLEECPPEILARQLLPPDPSRPCKESTGGVLDPDCIPCDLLDPKCNPYPGPTFPNADEAANIAPLAPTPQAVKQGQVGIGQIPGGGQLLPEQGQALPQEQQSVVPDESGRVIPLHTNDLINPYEDDLINPYEDDLIDPTAESQPTQQGQLARG